MTIGKLTTLAHLAAPFLIWGAHDPVKYAAYYGLLLLYYLGMMLLCALTDVHTPAFWFIAPDKRMFHAELGEVWASFADDKTGFPSDKKVYLYKQRWLYLKEIGVVEYTDSKESLVRRIKSELDTYCAKKILSKKKNKSVLDDWDGYFDDQSRREDRLNQIGLED